MAVICVLHLAQRYLFHIDESHCMARNESPISDSYYCYKDNIIQTPAFSSFLQDFVLAKQKTLVKQGRNIADISTRLMRRVVIVNIKSI